MDLISSNFHPKGQTCKTNEFHEGLTSFCGNNGTLKASKYSKACKENAPKMLEKKTSSIFEDATYKGYKVFHS